MNTTLKVALLAAALGGFGVGAALAQGEECKDMIAGIDAIIEKAQPDKVPTETGKCAAFGEFIGTMKMFRVVSDECLPEGEKRFKTLATIERTIRKLTSEVDRKCR